MAQREGVFDDVSWLSFSDFFARQWLKISRNLGLAHDEANAALAKLQSLIEPWGRRRIGERCDYPSYLSHDGFPAEISVSWRQGRPELRILFESLAGTPPDQRRCQEAGQVLTRRLADWPGASIDRYLAVEDLFSVTHTNVYQPMIWHALSWLPGNPLRFKVYLNPQIWGVDRAHEVVGEAMHRLGLSTSWQPVAQRHARLAAEGHELEFFAIDLDDSQRARVKVYYRHLPMPLSELGNVAALARYHNPARAAAAIATIYGRDTGLVENEPMTCLAFRAGSDGPEEANLYLRLPENTASDADAAKRISAVMQGEGIDPAPYQRLVEDMAPASLTDITGLQELLSFRTTARESKADIGTYFRFGVYPSPVVPRPRHSAHLAIPETAFAQNA